MKRVLLVVLAVMVSGSIAWALTGTEYDGSVKDLKGWHYTLNIIGVQNPKTAPMDGGNKGGVIFVALEGKTEINLVKNTEAGLDEDQYAVLDKNGTDADGALLALPDPGLSPYFYDPETGEPIIGYDPVTGDPIPVTEADTVSDYSVYVRPLGKPLQQATITTCAQVDEEGLAAFMSKPDVRIINDAAKEGYVCSIEQVGHPITFRNKGKTSFTNVTAELLTIVLAVEIYDDLGGYVATVYARIPIFDPLLEGEYWDYDNDGLKLLQVRFYPWGTDMLDADANLPALPQEPQP